MAAPELYDVQKLKRHHWLAVYVALAVNIAWANWLAPAPWGNDFEGLGLTTTLMDRAGWQYCISDNWGFAHTSLHYLLTRVTGDLWLTSRLICALSLFFLVFFAERVMRCTFDVRSAMVRTTFLLVLAVTPLVTSLALCFYLETVAITLFMAALSMLNTRQPIVHLIGGLLATAGSWFRFHFLIYGALYVVMVYFYQHRDRPKQRAFWSAAGFGLAVLVTAGVCKLATGSWMASNQKAVLAAWTPGFSWEIGYQVRLNYLSYGEIMQHFDWLRMLTAFAKNWLINPQFVVTCSSFFWVGYLVLQHGSMLQNGAPRGVPRGSLALQNPLVGIMSCILLAIIPFMIIRGERNYRLSADLLIFAVPWFAGIYAHCTGNVASRFTPCACSGHDSRAKSNRHLLLGLLCAALVTVTLLPALHTYSFYTGNYQSWQRIDRQLDGILPQEVRARTPEIVLSMFFHPNRANRYWLWRPVVLYGWPLRSEAFRRHFGFISSADIPELARQGTVRYVVLKKDTAVATIPQHAIKRASVLDDVIVVELRQ
jgi:hypothetical protein